MDAVTGGVHVWNRGTVIFVYRDVAAIIDGQTRFLKSKAVHGRSAARRKECRFRL